MFSDLSGQQALCAGANLDSRLYRQRRRDKNENHPNKYCDQQREFCYGEYRLKLVSGFLNQQAS